MLSVIQKINLEVDHKKHVHMCRKREFIPFHFLENFCRISVLVCGRYLLPLTTFNDICPGFQSQDGIPSLVRLCHLHAMLFLRIIFGVTPADLLAVSITAEPFLHMNCTESQV